MVLRDVTERPEAVTAGTARLVGTDENAVLAEAVRLLTDAAAYSEIAEVANPFGDGTAALQVVDALDRWLD